MRFGRHPTQLDYLTKHFADYATALPAPPPSFDSKARVYAALGGESPAIFPMDGNDQYGDCTIAARAHCDTIWQAFDGAKYIPTRGWCLKLYFHLTGGVDSGLNLITVLKNWQHQSTAADDILAYVSIDPQDHVHMQQAVALFGAVYIGFQVTSNMIPLFNAHQPWVPGHLIAEGHAVAITGYTGSNQTDMLNVLTWGSVQQAEWAWWDQVSSAGRGEAYAIVPKAAQNPAFAPGFDLATLEADLADVAG